MPTCRRKRVVLTEPSEALLLALKSDPNRPVFYLDQTGEIFESYECVVSHNIASSRQQQISRPVPMPRACPSTV